MDATIRAQFPLLNDVTYLNSASVCLMPVVSQDAGQCFREQMYRRRPDALDAWLAQMEVVRGDVARFIGAQPGEVAFVGNTGDGETLVANGLEFRAGDNIVIDDLEYPSGHIVWRETARRFGLELREVQSVNGAATPEMFASMVDDHTQLVAVAHVSHHNGYRHDLKALSALAHAHGALVFADATQVVGSFRMDVRDLDVDFLVCATYKWTLGPLGLAFFYAKAELMDELQTSRWGWMQAAESDAKGRPIRLRSDARKFEYGTLPFQGLVELKTSLEFLQEIGMERVEAQVFALNERLHAGLRAAGADVWTPAGNRTGMLTIHNLDARRVGEALEREGIITAVRPAPRNQIRISAHFYNTDAEIDRCVQAVGRLL
ncbi:MAG: aminotransferase class V-fold PLP-dependent enzyme [Chloroflexi bacterium]|nr:aminotransferase class V-fold PLP-dependent enzyme [Chloroflexota bacterium]